MSEILSDRPHLKGIGARPFINCTHRGALPFSYVSDASRVAINDSTFVTIPAPSVTAWIVLDSMGDKDRQDDTASLSDKHHNVGNLRWTYDDPTPPYWDPYAPKYVSIVPDSIADFVSKRTEYATAALAVFFLNPSPPSLSGTYSVDEAEAVAHTNAIDGEAQLFRSHAPTKKWVGVQSARFMRVTGSPSNGVTQAFNPDAPDPKYLLPVKYIAATSKWTETYDAVKAGYVNGTYLMYPMSHGWTYAVQIDDDGTVKEAVALPEPCVVSCVLAFAYDKVPDSGLTVGISWPTGVRLMLGDVFYSTTDTPEAWKARLFWRPADPWSYHVPMYFLADLSSWTYNNMTAPPTQGIPRLVDEFHGIYRGVYGPECGCFGGPFDDFWAVTSPTGGWKVLADFDSTDGKTVVGTLSATLPTEGQEIIVWGGCNLRQPLEYRYRPFRLTLWPEPSKSPIPLALALGGVLGGA